ncbi:MAG: PAS domain-containing protein [bacterium]
MSFIDDSTLEEVPELSSDELDELDFGAVKVDENGVVEEYNHYESEMAGVDPETAKGQNFFTEVAPCTNNQLFYGQFQDGMEKGELDMEMDYTFTYKMKPTNVKIRLFHDQDSETNWVFVKKKD